MKFSAVIVVYVVAIVCSSDSLDNGLARTPPMGWMHWERFRCGTDCKNYPDECISESLFKRTADILVSDGYADAGYKYVIIDDCWQSRDRDPFTKQLLPDRERFPSGMKSLADYIHQKNLKLGLYQNYGTSTCSGYPGVINHMELDTQTFADWNVDYVKLTACHPDINDLERGFPEFGRLLNKTGRHMVFSCAWPMFLQEKGRSPNYTVLKETCNSWRNYVNIQDNYESLLYVMAFYSKNQDQIQPHGGPGHWNDPDMLTLGNYGLTYDQSKIQMAVWAILAAPLIMSNDLWDVRPEIKDILLNRRIIAVNQDPLGIQGRRVDFNNNIEIWSRPITPLNDAGYYSYAIAFVNRRAGISPQSVTMSLSALGMRNTKGYKITDLFDGMTEVDKYMPQDTFATRINPTGVNFFKFTVL